MKDSLEEKDTRKGGENEARGSRDAQRALAKQREMDRSPARKQKRKARR
jgi:hypothetical protein